VILVSISLFAMLAFCHSYTIGSGPTKKEGKDG
jgi:hypothetical protein